MICVTITTKYKKKLIYVRQNFEQVLYNTLSLGFPFLSQLTLYLCLAVLALASEISLCCFRVFYLACVTGVIFGYVLSLLHWSVLFQPLFSLLFLHLAQLRYKIDVNCIRYTFIYKILAFSCYYSQWDSSRKAYSVKIKSEH